MIDQKLDLPVVELLFSRMCHDLVGPVGAAVNGVELLEEFGSEMADEALNLLGSSARVASKRLRVYRVAYGMATGAAITSLGDLRSLIDDYIDGGKIDLKWPDDDTVQSISMKRFGIKLILNMVICATESMPRGGTLTLDVQPEGEQLQLAVSSIGEGVRLADGVAEAFDVGTDPQQLDPRTVQAYFTAKIAETVGAALTYQESGESITFQATIPAGV